MLRPSPSSEGVGEGLERRGGRASQSFSSHWVWMRFATGQFLCSFVRALAKLLGGPSWFLPCTLGSHMSRLRHLGWSQCSHGLSSRPLESCHRQCLKAVCGGFGCIPEGQLQSFWMALLSSVTVPIFLPLVCPPGLYPGLEMGMVNGSMVLLEIILIMMLIWGRAGSGLLRRHVQVCIFVIMQSGSRASNAEEMEKDCDPLRFRGSGGVRSACLAIFFLELGLGEFFAPGDAWNLLSRGYRHRGILGWTVQPKGSVHWHWSILVSCTVHTPG